MAVGFDVETFVSAIGENEGSTELSLALLDQAYENAVAALMWGDRAIIAKEVSDLVYHAVAALVRLGIPFDDVWAALHESNMSRLDEDGKAQRDEYGKVLQGPKYKGPEERIQQLVKQS